MDPINGLIVLPISLRTKNTAAIKIIRRNTVKSRISVNMVLFIYLFLYILKINIFNFLGVSTFSIDPYNIFVYFDRHNLIMNIQSKLRP